MQTLHNNAHIHGGGGGNNLSLNTPSQSALSPSLRDFRKEVVAIHKNTHT
ncbi:hypothetical protein [Helicobacter canis]|uniref:Uncharacterized protein n=1 Tax=Helicobacter canis TaxID=29419 RepID=A0A377JLF6_9HELI|nr:hypothetical protein [Helicobacter canis]STO96915.1 Uncharacterised protein [Helicobacter canis]STP06551.1 Uncharacterised protein [Helicobacter canis]